MKEKLTEEQVRQRIKDGVLHLTAAGDWPISGIRAFLESPEVNQRQLKTEAYLKNIALKVSDQPQKDVEYIPNPYKIPHRIYRNLIKEVVDQLIEAGFIRSDRDADKKFPHYGLTPKGLQALRNNKNVADFGGKAFEVVTQGLEAGEKDDLKTIQLGNVKAILASFLGAHSPEYIKLSKLLGAEVQKGKSRS